MRFFILLLFCFGAMLLEGSLTTIPILLSILIACWTCRLNPLLVYGASFIGGMFLDIAHVEGIIGMTGVVYIFFLFIVSLYERKFEIHTFQFAGFASFIGAFIFLTIFKHEFIIIQSIIATGITLILFALFREKKMRRAYGEL